jgi:hypothetical protein
LDSFDQVVGHCQYGRLGHAILDCVHLGDPNSTGKEGRVIDIEEDREVWCNMLGEETGDIYAHCHRDGGACCKVYDIYYFDVM